jgi:hypothetical protein
MFLYQLHRLNFRCHKLDLIGCITCPVFGGDLQDAFFAVIEGDVVSDVTHSLGKLTDIGYRFAGEGFSCHFIYGDVRLLVLGDHIRFLGLFYIIFSFLRVFYYIGLESIVALCDYEIYRE